MSADTIFLNDLRGKPHEVAVDAEDMHLITGHTWRVHRGGYVVRLAGGKSIFLHRVLMSPAPGLIVDHINGDKLDNRRCNLRVCTNAENSKNQRLSVNNTSGFKGVRRNSVCGKWEAIIKNNGEQRYLGMFDDPRVAAHAYNRAAVELHGEFARLNPL